MITKHLFVSCLVITVFQGRKLNWMLVHCCRKWRL